MVRAVVVLWLAALAAGFAADAPRQSFEDDVAAVHGAVLGKMFEGQRVTCDSNIAIDRIVIVDTTTTKRAGEAISARSHGTLSEVEQETFDGFVAATAEPRPLPRTIPTLPNYLLISEADLQDAMRPDPKNGRSFYDRYPRSGGFVRLSAVGFNATRTQALLFMSRWCGNVCGTGFLIVASKAEGLDGHQRLDSTDIVMHHARCA